LILILLSFVRFLSSFPPCNKTTLALFEAVSFSATFITIGGAEAVFAQGEREREEDCVVVCPKLRNREKEKKKNRHDYEEGEAEAPEGNEEEEEEEEERAAEALPD